METKRNLIEREARGMRRKKEKKGNEKEGGERERERGREGERRANEIG